MVALFLVGLQMMNKEEKVSLLAQVNAFTTVNVLSDAAQKGAKGARNFVLKWCGKAAHVVGQKVGRFSLSAFGPLFNAGCRCYRWSAVQGHNQ